MSAQEQNNLTEAFIHALDKDLIASQLEKMNWFTYKMEAPKPYFLL